MTCTDKIIETQSVNTYTDGVLTGAAAYEFGLRDWNDAYRTQWCQAKEASLTSVLYPWGVPAPVAGTFSCSWHNEPSSSSDVTSVIKLNYCKTKVIKFEM